MQAKKPVFRQVALERLSSPEQLDQLMQVTSPKGWLALLAVGGLVAAALLWSIFGTIPAQMAGQGILLRTGGVANIFVASDGQIKKIHVHVGDVVRAGQVVARLAPTDATENSRVISPYSGRVIEIQAGEGSVVSEGTPLLSLEPNQSNAAADAVVYVPAAEGKKIKPGMEVQISPSTVKREEFGFILGRVTAVGEFPASRQGMLRVLGSEELVDKFAAIDTPIEVQVELLPDATSASGYQWSSKAPDITIANGTLCSAQIVVERRRPLSMVLPLLKETMGVN